MSWVPLALPVLRIGPALRGLIAGGNGTEAGFSPRLIPSVAAKVNQVLDRDVTRPASDTVVRKFSRMNQESDCQPNWERERCQRFWDPPRRLLRSIRMYQRWKNRGFLGRLGSRYWVLSHRFWSVVTGADIPLNCQIAGGLNINHSNGIVIHSRAVIGPNCHISQQVTIGMLNDPNGLPRIGCGVDFGAGAKVLGGVSIGDGARVGANAVVLCDVPPGCTAVGIPARVIPPRDQRSGKRPPAQPDQPPNSTATPDADDCAQRSST